MLRKRKCFATSAIELRFLGRATRSLDIKMAELFRINKNCCKWQVSDWFGGPVSMKALTESIECIATFEKKKFIK
jgi:hypothetical protein